MSSEQVQPFRPGYYLWQYVPSLAGAVIFALLFAGVSSAHTWRLFKNKLWFCIPFTVGGIQEFVGYVARAVCHFQTSALIPYAMQSCMLLLPPGLFAASIYMMLGRVVRATGGERHSLVPVRRLTTTFVLGDVTSYGVQSGGAGIMVTGGSNLAVGKWIVVCGLLMQVAMFLLFCATAVLFQYRLERERCRDGWHPWRESLFVLYAVSALILVRNIFRVVEFAMGNGGYPLTHEWTLYVFDSILMFAVMVIVLYWYPSKIRKDGRAVICLDGPGPHTELASLRPEERLFPCTTG